MEEVVIVPPPVLVQMVASVAIVQFRPGSGPRYPNERDTPGKVPGNAVLISAAPTDA